jgi:hypothetical protein
MLTLHLLADLITAKLYIRPITSPTYKFWSTPIYTLIANNSFDFSLVKYSDSK